MNSKKYSAEYYCSGGHSLHVTHLLQSLCLSICQRSSQHSKILRILRILGILRILIVLGILGILKVLRILRILMLFHLLIPPASRMHQILSSRTVSCCVFPSFPRCPRLQTRCLRCSRCQSLPESRASIYSWGQLFIDASIYKCRFESTGAYRCGNRHLCIDAAIYS